MQGTVGRVRAFEAARRGCHESDIAWFPKLTPMATPEHSTSHSSVLATPECITSAMMALALTCIELCLCHGALTAAAGALRLVHLALN